MVFRYKIPYINFILMKNLVLLTGLLTASLLSCKSEPVIEETQPEVVQVFQPMVVDTTLSVDYVAEIQAVQKVEIRSHIRGYLEKILVDEGKFVRKGQTLFTINNLEAKEGLNKAIAMARSAEVEVKSAELEAINKKSLVDKKILSETEFQAATNKIELMKARLSEAKSNVESARIALNYCSIKAPFDGTVNRIPNKIGSQIDDGTLLTTITQNNEVFAYFNVSEKDYLDMVSLPKGDETSKHIKLTLANGVQYPLEGFIETNEAEIEEGTGTLAYRARFRNPEKILIHGSTGKVTLNKPIRNAMLIPQKSTFEIQDRTYVYVMDANGKLKTRPVAVANALTYYFIIESGLSTTDKIVYEGIQNLKDGMEVKATTIGDAKLKADFLSLQATN